MKSNSVNFYISIKFSLYVESQEKCKSGISINERKRARKKNCLLQTCCHPELTTLLQQIGESIVTHSESALRWLHIGLDCIAFSEMHFLTVALHTKYIQSYKAYNITVIAKWVKWFFYANSVSRSTLSTITTHTDTLTIHNPFESLLSLQSV